MKLHHTPSDEEPHPSDEGWGVAIAALKTLALIVFVFALIVLYAETRP